MPGSLKANTLMNFQQANGPKERMPGSLKANTLMNFQQANGPKGRMAPKGIQGGLQGGHTLTLCRIDTRRR